MAGAFCWLIVFVALASFSLALDAGDIAHQSSSVTSHSEHAAASYQDCVGCDRDPVQSPHDYGSHCSQSGGCAMCGLGSTFDMLIDPAAQYFAIAAVHLTPGIGQFPQDRPPKPFAIV